MADAKQHRKIPSTVRKRMRLHSPNVFKIGGRLTVIFSVLIALIIGGNGLLIWQFLIGRFQTERLSAASRQLVAVVRLQQELLFLHQRLDELTQEEDLRRLENEGPPLARAIVEQVHQTRATLNQFPNQTPIDPDLLATLDAIEISLPSQVNAIVGLANSGDWAAVRSRVSRDLEPMETESSYLVNSLDREMSEELDRTIANMQPSQQRILVIVPVTAISTFCIAAFFGWAITRRMTELRAEERVEERTRIARELHDTLLQSLHGLMFKFQAARNMLPNRPSDAVRVLDDAISKMELAVAESRDAIHDLRSELVTSADLIQLLVATCRELASVQDEIGDAPAFSATVEGDSRRLVPDLQVEIYRIARELLRNAFSHARAHRIEIDVRYLENELRLRIRDDGTGIDPNILQNGTASGHWGLHGTRERARQIGAELEFWSEVGAGTEIQISIPASIAYLKPQHDTRSRQLRNEDDKYQHT